MKGVERGVEEKMSTVLAMLKDDKPISQICQEQGISESLAYRWRDEALEGMRVRFSGKKANRDRSQAAEVERLLKLVGQQAYAIECQKKISQGCSL